MYNRLRLWASRAVSVVAELLVLFYSGQTLGDFTFLNKNYFLEESDYLNDKLPDKISPELVLRRSSYPKK